jgi:F420H(2)-dependent quinone reductase
MKHQVVHALQKYVLNPPIKLLFAMGIVPPGYAVLETIGRTTGKARRTPVGDARVGNQFWIVAEHGMKAGYVLRIIRGHGLCRAGSRVVREIWVADFAGCWGENGA